MIVILHNIRSLHNVGSIFRTSDAVGVEKLYLCGITPTPLNKYNLPNDQLTKTALGAEKTVAWEKIGTSTPKTKLITQSDLNKSAITKPTLDLIKKLKLQGYKIFSIEQAKNSIPYSKTKLNNKQLSKTVLIFGPEVVGLQKEILNASDKILEIPMHGQKNSLNVSVAFGVVAYSLLDN